MKNKLGLFVFVVCALVARCVIGIVVEVPNSTEENISSQINISQMHHASSTGVWEFVSMDGNTITQKWAHNESLDWTMHTHEPWNYARDLKKTGLLFIWWDHEQKRKHSISEWEEGKKEGAEIEWYPSGKLLFVGSVRDGYYKNMTFWKEDGTFLEIKVGDVYKEFTGRERGRPAHCAKAKVKRCQPVHFTISTNSPPKTIPNIQP